MVALKDYILSNRVNPTQLERRVGDADLNPYPKRDLFVTLTGYASDFIAQKAEPRLIAISGLRGVGKSTLMWQAAADIFNRGVLRALHNSGSFRVGRPCLPFWREKAVFSSPKRLFLLLLQALSPLQVLIRRTYPMLRLIKHPFPKLNLGFSSGCMRWLLIYAGRGSFPFLCSGIPRRQATCLVRQRCALPCSAAC